jgi:Xaa-Pro aminopeptidase
MQNEKNETFRRRRLALLDAMRAHGSGDAVLVLASWPIQLRNGDVEQEYRQDSDLFYLTGFTEPEAVLVLSTREKKTTLFVRARDPEREIWDGARAGLEGAKADFGADEAFAIGEFEKELPRLLGNHDRLYYRLNRDRQMDERVLDLRDRLRSRGRTPTTYPHTIVDPGSLLHEMRLIKDDSEIASMRRAAEISGEAHRRAMALAKPGLFEYEIEGALLDTFRKRGAERQAYGAIVGSGPNATVLHYRANDRRLEDGDLLLIDAGCEFGHYASDITRTFPVNGTFSARQKEIYEIVLEAQLASIAATKPGATLEQIHRASVETITRGLVRIGLLTGDVEKLIEAEAYKPFYMHRTSHWLGMDVHDVGAYFENGKGRRLAAGMVITIEPGIYIAKDAATVPESHRAYRGIGVRIEDDILVTATGSANLTEHVPKTVEDVERACLAGPA